MTTATVQSVEITLPFNHINRIGECVDYLHKAWTLLSQEQVRVGAINKTTPVVLLDGDNILRGFELELANYHGEHVLYYKRWYSFASLYL